MRGGMPGMFVNGAPGMPPRMVYAMEPEAKRARTEHMLGGVPHAGAPANSASAPANSASAAANYAAYGGGYLPAGAAMVSGATTE